MLLMTRKQKIYEDGRMGCVGFVRRDPPSSAFSFVVFLVFLFDNDSYRYRVSIFWWFNSITISILIVINTIIIIVNRVLVFLLDNDSHRYRLSTWCFYSISIMIVSLSLSFIDFLVFLSVSLSLSFIDFLVFLFDNDKYYRYRYRKFLSYRTEMFGVSIANIATHAAIHTLAGFVYGRLRGRRSRRRLGCGQSHAWQG